MNVASIHSVAGLATRDLYVAFVVQTPRTIKILKPKPNGAIILPDLDRDESLKQW